LGTSRSGTCIARQTTKEFTNRKGKINMKSFSNMLLILVVFLFSIPMHVDAASIQDTNRGVMGHDPYSSVTVTEQALAGDAIYHDLYATYLKDIGQCGVELGDLHGVMEGGVSPLPEPATMLLFGAGLIGLAATGKRKFQKI
jgi:hypothetical protein